MTYSVSPRLKGKRIVNIFVSLIFFASAWATDQFWDGLIAALAYLVGTIEGQRDVMMEDDQ